MKLGTRVLLTILTAVLAAAAVAGFGISHTLSPQGTAEFSAEMQPSIQDAEIQREVQAELRTGLTAAGEELAARAGPLAGLARSGAAQLAEQAVATVSTQRFQAAWQEWVDILATGLAAAANGTPDPSVQVEGTNIVVEIAPLLAAITGDSVAGGVTGILTSLGRDTTFTVTTGVDLQQLLTIAGRLAQWDWLLATAAVLLGAITVTLGGNRGRWLGVILLSSATGCAAVAALLAQASSRPAEQMPALSRGVMTALTGPWVEIALRVGSVLAVAGVLALTVSALLGTRRGGDRAAAQA